MDQLSDDAGAGRDTHFDHDEPQEDFHCVYADIHSLRYFFACKPLREILYGLAFAVRQLKARYKFM
jgi:hypothetical protein